MQPERGVICSITASVLAAPQSCLTFFFFKTYIENNKYSEYITCLDNRPPHKLTIKVVKCMYFVCQHILYMFRLMQLKKKKTA